MKKLNIKFQIYNVACEIHKDLVPDFLPISPPLSPCALRV